MEACQRKKSKISPRPHSTPEQGYIRALPLDCRPDRCGFAIQDIHTPLRLYVNGLMLVTMYVHTPPTQIDSNKSSRSRYALSRPRALHTSTRSPEHHAPRRMAPLSRSVRPTRRDACVAIFTALCVLGFLFLDTRVDSGHRFAPVPAGSRIRAEPQAASNYHDGEGILAAQAVTNPRKPHDRVKPKAVEIMPSTKIVAHAPGWTIFDNLYM